MNAQSTYSGQTTLTSGIAIPTVSSVGSVGSLTSGPFGTGALVLAGGSLRGTTSAITVGNAVTIANDSAFPTVANEANLILSGPITLTGNRVLTVDYGSSVIGTALVFSNAIGDGGNNYGLTKAGAGTLFLSGTNTYGGATNVTGGVLLTAASTALSGYNVAGRVAFNGGTIAARTGAGGWSTAQIDTLLANAVKTSGTLGIDTTTASQTQWTAFTTTNFGPSLGLTKYGVNALTLSFANNYTGATNVLAGVLTVQNATGLGTTNAGTTVAAGARLELDGAITVTGEALTISGDGENFFGALQSKNGASEWTGPITVAANGTRIGAAANSSLKVSGVISGAAANSLTFRPEDSTAAVTITGSNTYAGTTSILGGTVSISSLNSVVGGAASSSLAHRRPRRTASSRSADRASKAPSFISVPEKRQIVRSISVGRPAERRSINRVRDF
ncbi:MAG: autotransporter-associated beta strand repeat-containing protein [Pirellulales bacterium]